MEKGPLVAHFISPEGSQGRKGLLGPGSGGVSQFTVEETEVLKGKEIGPDP